MSTSAYRLFDVVASEVSRPSPGFVRVVLSGPDLERFGFVGIDQRVKLLLPNRRGTIPQLEGGDGWYQSWCALDDEERPPMRTYTPRAFSRDARGARLTIDFARHDAHPGPASAWAEAAVVGDAIAILGPDAEYDGPNSAVGWIPPRAARRFLIVGDDTALPAIAGILASLDRDACARVILEVSDAADAGLLEAGAMQSEGRLELTVLEREESDRGAALVAAVRALSDVFPGADAPIREAAGEADEVNAAEWQEIDVDREILWEVPGMDAITGAPLPTDSRHSEGYAWLAGEAGAIKLIRRQLVQERGIDRQSVAFMGYWRRGRAEN
ncbi:siderophore-interacting protein [Leucobacter sp. NPDC077196]|uniref:siderophore-interacting protein n=1 Tax=Leucobacter sp. NPDC077196 TaxID=3154959 RepID=UPI00343233E2